VATPAIAIWNCIPSGATLFQYFLDRLYNNATYQPLMANDPISGKMLFFVPDNPDPTITAVIESNGGRNNIVVVSMWAQFNPSEFSRGKWAFFSPCLDPVSGAYTTTPGERCNQHVTTNSPLGNSITVSASYQLQYSSLPFGAIGKRNGGTMALQFQTAFAVESHVKHIFISSFNEFIAQPQPNPFQGPYSTSMGLDWDPAKRDLWVDTYGCGISRDIEPTVECGAEVYDMMGSCLRSLAILQEQRKRGARQGTVLNVEGESCCDPIPLAARRLLIYSFERKDHTDFILTNSATEASTIILSGAFNELCNAWRGPTIVCSDTKVANLPQAANGPFLLAGLDTAVGPMLYRCSIENGRLHFFSTRSDCEGQHTDYALGRISSTRTSEFPRSLRRCLHQPGTIHYHSLDFSCRTGDTEEAMYGYVH
jgi:hypothetical protein